MQKALPLFVYKNHCLIKESSTILRAVYCVNINHIDYVKVNYKSVARSVGRRSYMQDNVNTKCPLFNNKTCIPVTLLQRY